MTKRLIFTVGGRSHEDNDALAVVLDEQLAKTWFHVLKRYLNHPDQEWPIYMAELGTFEDWPEAKPEEPAPE